MTRATWLSLSLALLIAPACGGTPGAGGAGGGDGGPACPNDLPPRCPSPAPTWANDVAGIVAARCASCHAPDGAAAEKPLTSYAEVFKLRSAVLNQVHACKMPQAGAPELTPTERAALQAWLVCGAIDD